MIIAASLIFWLLLAAALMFLWSFMPVWSSRPEEHGDQQSAHFCLCLADLHVYAAQRAHPSECLSFMTACTEMVLEPSTCSALSPSRFIQMLEVSKAPNDASASGYGLDEALAVAAKEVEPGLKAVIMLTATSQFLTYLMNAICNLRRVQLADYVVVSAFDKETYYFIRNQVCYNQSLCLTNWRSAARLDPVMGLHYKACRGLCAFLQGVAVFYEPLVLDGQVLGTVGCEFLDPCYEAITKLKPVSVLRALKKGVAVLFSDVDIIYFQNPFPYLVPFGPGNLIFQSDIPTEDLPPRRTICTGFYFARPEEPTMRLIDKVLNLTPEKGDWSDQAVFDRLLCSYLDGECDEMRNSGVKIGMLEPRKFPNGAVYKYWEAPNVREACADCVIIHNNFVVGRDAKLMRQKKAGFWFYLEDTAMCMYDWMSTTTRSA